MSLNLGEIHTDTTNVDKLSCQRSSSHSVPHILNISSEKNAENDDVEDDSTDDENQYDDDDLLLTRSDREV